MCIYIEEELVLEDEPSEGDAVVDGGHLVHVHVHAHVTPGACAYACACDTWCMRMR